MARDYPVRQDLLRIGLPDRTIRVLEKAALLVDLIAEQSALQGEIAAIDLAVDALAEDIEDANLSLESLDDRLDDQENGNGPYVKKTGDTMSGALNVNALLECDTFRINVTPTAETVVCTHTVAISVNGVAYKFPVIVV